MLQPLLVLSPIRLDLHLRLHVCVCERERESARARECVCANMCVCVCVCDRKREGSAHPGPTRLLAPFQSHFPSTGILMLSPIRLDLHLSLHVLNKRNQSGHSKSHVGFLSNETHVESDRQLAPLPARARRGGGGRFRILSHPGRLGEVQGYLAHKKPPPS